MALEFQNSVVEAALTVTGARLMGTPAWLNHPGRLECGPVWGLAQDVYRQLTGLALPEVMPPRERRAVDAVLKYADGSHQILEVDESQYFNEYRALTLRSYNDTPVAFDRDAWLDACDQKGRLEGGGFAIPKPPLFPEENGRHQQRAFRDALCDLIPSVYGFHPTARVAYFEGASGPNDLLKARLHGPVDKPSEAVDKRTSRPASRAGGGAKGRTQRITNNDLKTGQIRIPSVTKRLFPPGDDTVTVVLRGWETKAAWRPRYGPDRERSGVLRIGREGLAGRVAPNEILTVSLDDQDRIAIE